MLATKIFADPSAKPEFPLSGSDALWQLRPCTIVQPNRDGTYLISGDGFRRFVALGELQDPARVHLTPFAQWMQARLELVDPREAERFTIVDELYDDYFDWCYARDGFSVRQDLVAFTNALSNAGIASRTITRRAQYSERTHHLCGFAVRLKDGR